MHCRAANTHYASFRWQECNEPELGGKITSHAQLRLVKHVNDPFGYHCTVWQEMGAAATFAIRKN